MAKPAAEELQKRHMDHITSMWKEGVLEAAGPVAKVEGIRGIFLFSTDVKTAKEWAAQDPKVQAGDLKADCFVWRTQEGVGKDYRARYGKPDFKERFAGFGGVLAREVPRQANWATGAIQHPKWTTFTVLTEKELAKDAMQGERIEFLWYHDPQVWPRNPE